MSATNTRWTQGSCLVLLSSDSAEQLCLVCGGKLVECAVKCGDCKKAAHLECTELPLYHLVRLASSRTAFACSTCVRGNAKINYTDLEAELQHLRRVQPSEVTQTESNTSAPPLSQIPSTIDILGDHENNEREKSGKTNDASDIVSDMLQDVRHARSKQGKRQRKAVCQFHKMSSCKHGKAGRDCNYEHPKKCFTYIKFGSNPEKGCREEKMSSIIPRSTASPSLRVSATDRVAHSTTYREQKGEKTPQISPDGREQNIKISLDKALRCSNHAWEERCHGGISRTHGH